MASNEEEKAKLSPFNGGFTAMAEESCRKRLRDEGTCPVCMNYFTDPVILDCGHNFCTACIANCWKLSPQKNACPLCREIVQTKKLRPNSQLASMVDIAKDLSSLLKHRGLFSVEKADQEYTKDRINHCLEILRKDRENILVYKAENEKESQNFLTQIEAEREKTVAIFKKQHQFLEEQEALFLSQMEETEKLVVRRRDELLARLTRELSSLDSHIRELEENQQKSTNELQNLGNITERFKRESIENLMKFTDALRWRIHEFQDINPFLEGMMKKFKDTLLSGFQIQQAKVTLDKYSAVPDHILSNDLKSVRWKNERQDALDNSEEFDHWPFLVGREEFKTGRVFWDVEVGPEEKWDVGVTKGPVWFNPVICPETGFWSLGMWKGEYRVHDPLHNLPLIVNQEVKKIRVTLNFEGQRVAFYDADTGRQLYVYSDVSFGSYSIYPYFSVSGGGRLTILS